MAIIGAWTLPHPPIAVPNIGAGGEKQIIKTISAFDSAAENIASLCPETIVFITPHGTLYSDYFHISPGWKAQGNFSRFGAGDVCFETEYDCELVEKISESALKNGIDAGCEGESDAALDHGVMVPMWFINRRYNTYRTVRISQSGMSPAEHYRLGQCISKAIEKTGRKTVLIASSDLSHKLKNDGPYGYAPEGPLFDNMITGILEKGDFLSLFSIEEKLRRLAAECGFNSLMVLAGCFDRLSVKSSLLSYEGPFGVGYAIAGFWPVAVDDDRDFLNKYENACQLNAEQTNCNLNEYCLLAKRSLESMVTDRILLPVDDGLPEEMLKSKAGVFVSIQKEGQLRGCIGTITPIRENTASEIIHNAVSAGLHDTRFSPVTESELPFLTYKVDILSPPESVSDLSCLEVKRYGVIVSHGNRRGLLLPDLEGVDTVEEQVAIAMRKGGIGQDESINIERFEVTRHE